MGTWIRRAPMPTPRHDFQIIGVGSRIYAVTGSNDLTVDVVEICDGVWGPAAVTVDDRIYAMGRAGDGVYRSELFVFDPDGDRWEALGPMPAGRSDLSAVVLGRRIYALGGRVEDGRGGEAWGCLDAVEVYDVDTDTWTTETPVPQKTAWQAATVAEGRIFVMGGGRAKTADSTSQWKSAEYRDDVHELVLD